MLCAFDVSVVLIDDGVVVDFAVVVFISVVVVVVVVVVVAVLLRSYFQRLQLIKKNFCDWLRLVVQAGCHN